jgi:hypothetical protein
VMVDDGRAASSLRFRRACTHRLLSTCSAAGSHVHHRGKREGA